MFDRVRFFVLLCLAVSVVDATNYFGGLLFCEPYGARSLGMGKTGYALADDESGLFYNPAGLAIPNGRWLGGAAGASFDLASETMDLKTYSLVYQNDRLKNIGLSAYFRDFSWGNGGDLDLLGAIGGGYRIYSNKVTAHSLGAAAKYYHYSLKYMYPFQGNEADSLEKIDVSWQKSAISFDAGYLFELFSRIRLAISIKNFGPDIRENDNGDQSREAQPFIFATGVGYKDEFGNSRFTVLEVATELSLSSIHYDDGTERTLATGLEVVFLRTLALRGGYRTSDYFSTSPDNFSVNSTLDHEASFGLGIRLLNHFEGDCYWMADLGWGYSHFGFALTYTRALNWRKSDLTWWRRDNRAR